MEAEIRPLDAETHTAGCDAVIRSLPYHFGDPDDVRECARAVRSERGLVVQYGHDVVAFATTAPTSSVALEITWLAVLASERRAGWGRLLVERVAGGAAASGFDLLCPLTLAPSVREPGVKDGHEGTRRFWARVGFIPVKNST